MLTLTSPCETALHRLPAGGKLLALALATLGLMALTDLRLIALVTAATALL